MRSRTRWTPEMDARLRDLRDAGRTFREIAHAMGISDSQATNRHLRLDPARRERERLDSIARRRARGAVPRRFRNRSP